MDQPSIQTTSLQKQIMGKFSASQHLNKTFLHPSIVRAKASSWPRHAEVTPLLLVINSRENSCSSWCNGSRLFWCFFGGKGKNFGGRGRVVQVGYGFHCFFDWDFGVYIIYIWTWVNWWCRPLSFQYHLDSWLTSLFWNLKAQSSLKHPTVSPTSFMSLWSFDFLTFYLPHFDFDSVGDSRAESLHGFTWMHVACQIWWPTCAFDDFLRLPLAEKKGKKTCELSASNNNNNNNTEAH